MELYRCATCAYHLLYRQLPTSNIFATTNICCIMSPNNIINAGNRYSTQGKDFCIGTVPVFRNLYATKALYLDE